MNFDAMTIDDLAQLQAANDEDTNQDLRAYLGVQDSDESEAE